MRITRLRRTLEYRRYIQITLRTLGTVLDCVPMLLNNSRPSSYVAKSNRGLAGARGASEGNAVPSRSYTSEVIKRDSNYLARQSLIFIVVSTASVSCLSCDVPSLLMKRRDTSRPRFPETEVYTDFFINQFFALPWEKKTRTVSCKETFVISSTALFRNF